MTDFLPPNFELPAAPGGRYYKLQPGENRFRVLDSPVTGYETWIEADGKRSPVRAPKRADFAPDVDPVKYFWALPVWSYRDNAVMVWEATQRSIIAAITDLVKDDDWKNPREYDLVVTRTGEGMETEYAVKPKMPTKLPAEIEKAWKDVQFAGFDLTALFRGQDPFAGAVQEISIDDIQLPEA